MAIKGKGKTKGRRPGRAPRREPVEVKPPFFMRHRVQMAIAFVVGFLLFMFGVWVTNGLREDRADDQAKAEAANQRKATLAWQSTLEGAFGAIGTINPGAAPTILPDVGMTIASLQKGDAPADAAKTLKQAQDDAQGAIHTIKKVALADEVRDLGFTVAEVNYFLNSQTRSLEALELYVRAASLATVAVDATGAERTTLADEAAKIQSTADQILGEGWSDYQQALYAGGIAQTPLGAGNAGGS